MTNADRMAELIEAIKEVPEQAKCFYTSIRLTDGETYEFRVCQCQAEGYKFRCPRCGSLEPACGPCMSLPTISEKILNKISRGAYISWTGSIPHNKEIPDSYFY